MSFSAIPSSLRRRVFLRDGGRCQYCGLLQFGQGAVFHINHIQPRSKGGATNEANLALQCPSCSLHKADKTEANDPASGELVQLFHPLNQRWTEHFSLSGDGSVVGKTDIGRATVAALMMNEALTVIARLLQLHLGLLEATE